MNYEIRRPKTSDSLPPVLIILHGYGADEFDLLPIASQLDQSFLAISIQAPIKLSWGGYAWYELTQTPTGFRENDNSRKKSEEMLLAELPRIIAKEGGDPNQVFLMGFSQGAAMCYSLIGCHDLSKQGIIIRAVIIMSGFIPADVTEVLRKKDLSQIPFFLSHGVFDELIPPLAMELAKNILQDAHAKTLAKEYEIGHGLTEETVSDIRNWMNSVISP
ncbi:MAG: alpha/beta hydrolase [Candidatus Kapaibacterium sp.]